MARPVTFTPERQTQCIQHVLDELAKGRALTTVLSEDENLPSVSLWFRWERDLEGLIEQVAHARELGVTVKLEEITDIADNVPAISDHVAKAKLRIYAREKQAQMIAPRRFGPRVDVTSAGEKLEAPKTVLVEARINSLLTQIMNRPEIDEETRGLLE